MTISLPDYLRDIGPHPFAYGDMDCALFASGWVARMAGVDPREFERAYLGRKEAIEIVRAHGGLPNLGRHLADQLPGLIEIEEPRVGDVGVVRLGDRHHFAICIGPRHWVFKTARGIATTHADQTIAWRYGCGAAGAEVVGAIILGAELASQALITAPVVLTFGQVVGTIVLAAPSRGVSYSIRSL